MTTQTQEAFYAVAWKGEEGKQETRHTSESGALNKARDFSKKFAKAQVAKIVKDTKHGQENIFKIWNYADGERKDVKENEDGTPVKVRPDPDLKAAEVEAREAEKAKAKEARDNAGAKKKAEAEKAKAAKLADREQSKKEREEKRAAAKAAKAAAPKKERAPRAAVATGMRQPEDRSVASSLAQIKAQFQAREGTKRDELLAKLYKNFNKQVPVSKVLSTLYGDDAETSKGALQMVVYSLNCLIDGKSLPYEIRKARGENKEMTIGLHSVG